MGTKKFFLNFVISTFLAIGGSSVAMDNTGEMISKMIPEQKIGQIIMLDFRKWKKEGDKEETPVVKMNNEISEIVKNYYIGNIILFAENFSDKNQSKQLVQSFKNLRYNSIPILFAVDQEGGKRVQRIRFNVQEYKDNGNIKNNNEAYQKGYDIGKELSELGINCNLAPVADVNSNPSNTVIGIRSFGSDPNVVAQRCENFIKGLHENWVIGTLKHFPGHGDTSKDSHLELPTVWKTENELEECEFIPFSHNINNADMIMTAHVLLPNIDKKYPATLSKKILSEILRKKLKYNGIIITDAMDMGAITKHFGKNEACKLAISAGADILCMPIILREKKDVIELKNLYSYLKQKIENNPEFKKHVDESVERILKLKSNLK